MQKKKVFISSVKSEFATERQVLFSYLTDGLYTHHRSIPANPLIAEAMYLNGTIERMGTGTQELAELCIEKGLKKPDFIQTYDFMTILYRSTIENVEDNTVENVGDAVGENVGDVVGEGIVGIIKSNPRITIEELSTMLKKTSRTIERNLKTLKSSGLIERIGTDRNGYWKTNDVGENVGEGVGENVGECVGEDVGEKLAGVLDIIKNNPSITIDELSAILQKTSRTIERNLKTLKSAGLIERIGPDKGGYWKINDGKNGKKGN